MALEALVDQDRPHVRFEEFDRFARKCRGRATLAAASSADDAAPSVGAGATHAIAAIQSDQEDNRLANGRAL